MIVQLTFGVVAMAQQTAVPSDQDPKHKTVFRNDYLLVLHVLLKPGENTGFHTHSRDAIAVEMAKVQITVQEPGKQPSGPRQVYSGNLVANNYARQSFTHKVMNVGKTNFEVLDIELLKRPDGPETKAVAPVAAENASMRAYRWELGPGVSSTQHTHERPYMIVAATPMKLKMASPDGQEMVHPVKGGDIHWVNQKGTHTLTNSGAKKGIIIEVELK